MTVEAKQSGISRCRWDKFLHTTQKQLNEKMKAEYSVQQPYEGVQDLVNRYFDHTEQKHILDIGCELGKNAIPFLEKGHRVTLLDISHVAINYTTANLKQRNLFDGVIDTMQVAIEHLPVEKGPYDAVIGTYAFPFITAGCFEEVMRNNVLGRVKPGGYFTGGFWGDEHSWAESDGVTVSSEEELNELFHSMDFEFIQFNVVKEERESVLNGKVTNHEFRVIAKRREDTT